MKKIRKYDIFELNFPKFAEGMPQALFVQGDNNITVTGFCENAVCGTVRFMPMQEGNWYYRAQWGDEILEGDFCCVPAAEGNHGPVRAVGCHFQYDDGTAYRPVGTTLYAWTHQGEKLEVQTLETLAQNAFNKVRMCIFPKSMPYNSNDPEFYPFERREDGSWDVRKPDQRYWEHLELRLQQLAELGIEADLILFHPYDRWGFATMSQEENQFYLSYVIRRLSSLHNIWWSLSNEYEFCYEKELEDWDRFGEMLAEKDPYKHLISVHNWVAPYPKRSWLTHVSFQGVVAECLDLRRSYELPTIVDECNYEGNIDAVWGNLSGFEMVNRMWYAVASGCYCTHGETFYREDGVLWWARGGQVYGEAPRRVAFLRQILDNLSAPLDPVDRRPMGNPNGQEKTTDADLQKRMKRMQEAVSRMPNGHLPKEQRQTTSHNDDCWLSYLGRMCQSFIDLDLPENGKYTVEILDVWEMSRKLAAAGVCGRIRVGLPGKEGIAILVTRLEGDPL